MFSGTKFGWFWEGWLLLMFSGTVVGFDTGEAFSLCFQGLCSASFERGDSCIISGTLFS